ncbi:2-dehydro-3-deoxyphosphogluconate aldolase [Virgibacillus indicus]|uniref:2-dehydro-3-deoxyphosphogluconate aldolase n=1 Tax=Virgibacillus indicus TaxID=2024554 RepID=A0A265NAE0_9BACI|nr:bifunctional 4-hydroxy-2-oxoglutarate aldolase/2-dehydro-3-deoxy-phosphogluconate aldolase [Virgibacillus indicus]OZU88266.1 2-dehydro-3-deoxyphosphogluconate aldolase [Virgibacillus indicus]
MTPMEIILKEQLISIIRIENSSTIEQIVSSLYNGGIRVVEITMNTPGALDAIRKINELFPDMLVGAGTVLNAEAAEESIQAGAKFLLAPALSQSTIQAGSREGVPVIPGVMTPTEALTAYEYGSEMVKVFPARTLGTEYAKDLAGPLPFIKLMAVGGITLNNAQNYLESSWHSLGIGSELVNSKLVAEENFEEIENKARKFIEIREKINFLSS